MSKSRGNVVNPDEIVEQIITGVKAKITAEQASGALNALKKLF